MRSMLTKTQRSDARGPSKLLSILAGAASLAVVGQVLSQSLATFALPAGHGRPTPTPSSRKVDHRARDDMPRHVLEVPLEEPLEEHVDAFSRPEVRVPYRINFFATPARSHESANFKYMERKLHIALEHVQDWVQQVDVRLTVEESTHKSVPGRHHNIQEQHHLLHNQQPALLDDELQASDSDPLAERRQLAPYHIEVSVKMRHGTIVLSKPKHAQGSFIEAIDHMHDTLKRMMRKEKEKRIEKRRHRRHFREQKPHDVEDERLSDADNMAMLKSGIEPDF
eukprot:TRINITY_DN6141_c0_g3_i1.p1 TRINITY_DN6141_c0_g3~~TRINITY_DN6141_c0_g3_i1.p1  ORF type:complete len:311 (-),score=56.45 TRINITY_DN6141_c0_g3_i1:466-1308(-)